MALAGIAFGLVDVLDRLPDLRPDTEEPAAGVGSGGRWRRVRWR